MDGTNRNIAIAVQPCALLVTLAIIDDGAEKIMQLIDLSMKEQNKIIYDRIRCCSASKLSGGAMPLIDAYLARILAHVGKKKSLFFQFLLSWDCKQPTKVTFFSFANSLSQLNYQGVPKEEAWGSCPPKFPFPTMLNSYCPQPYGRFYVSYRFNSHSLVITPSNQTRCKGSTNV
jgi:hypothetical protein